VYALVDHPTPTRQERPVILPVPDRSDLRQLRADNERRCDRLLARSELLPTSDLDWTQVGEHAVDPRVITCLVYMRDVEGFTTRYLSGLSAHPTTLGDPLIRRFLDVWQAEEGAHARAIDRFLAGYARARGIEVPAPQAAPPSDESLTERALVAATRPIGHVVAATHMVWGAVNELLTLTGYRLLSRRCGDPFLSELLDRIAAQESRHYSFYVLQAEWRLATSRLARAVVPWLLRRTWTPVGVGADYKRPEEFDAVLGFLATGPGGAEAVARMDRTLDRLPGCADLGLYRTAAAHSLATA
jgi:hypothetical protein